MKKRLLVLALSLIMLLQCACAAVPAGVVEGEAVLADNIISSGDVVLANAESGSTTINVVASDMAYVRGGSWANKNWNTINTERMASGTISSPLLVIKNGMENGDYTRVAFFKEIV